MEDDNKQDNNDSVLDELDSSLKNKYESEFAHIFEELEKNNNLGKAVDQIFNETNDLNKIQSKLLLIIKKHLKVSKKNVKKRRDADIDKDKIAKDITEFCSVVMQNLDTEPKIGKLSAKDRTCMLKIEVKKNLNKILKNFVVYEIYKIMNPKRIAGETAKENYRNNLIEGGQKLAEKYEGGKEADLKSYGSAKVSKIQQQAAAFRRGDGKNGQER
tara:strand:- start:10 stop:654 length:645 start_codon:yes stop_codon:yes gene_type:complete